MANFLNNLVSRGAAPVLEQVISFTNARHHVLVNNISNLNTVAYKMQDLPTEPFVAALDEAVTARHKRGTDQLNLRSNRTYKWDRTGRIQAQPQTIPDNNILFHDGNNRFVEKQMSQLNQNAMMHNTAVELLRTQQRVLESAIRGHM